MSKEIMFGKRDFTIAYNNIILELNTLLTTEDLESFEVESNLVWDSLGFGIDGDDEIIPIVDFTEENLYIIFRREMDKVFDKILLRHGIVSNIISIYHYLAVFKMLNNVKNNKAEKETYSMIIHGDYGLEDKMYMLLEDFTDTPIEVIENIDFSSLLLDTLEEFVTVTTETNTNIDMLSRALEILKQDSKFKNTILFNKIMNSEEYIMLDLKLGINIINSLLRENTEQFFKEEKLVFVDNFILELAFTYLFYNKDKQFKLSTLLTKDYILKVFDVTIDNNVLNNIINSITIGGK